MNKRHYLLAFIVVFLFSYSLRAQPESALRISKVFAVLSKSVDLKTSVIGDELILRTISDVVVDGQLMIPKGSRLVGQVAGAVARGKNESQSMLSIRIEKAVTIDGNEMRLQAIIAAIAAPTDSLPSDPTYAMMHSNEPKMIGSSPTGASNSGSLAASSKANSNAVVATAEIKGRMDQALLLTEDSQGAVGYEDISISWQLAFPPPLTVFTSKAKNLKLEAGTQVLIRMASPRVAK